MKGLSRLHLGFLLIILTMVAVGVLISALRGAPVYAFATFLFVGLVLVNIPRWVRRDLTNAERSLHKGDFADTRRLAEKFLDRMRRRPWLSHIARIGFERNAPTVEVVALGILMQAQMALDDHKGACESLEMALSKGGPNGLGLPDEGSVGLKILNDDQTPMEFVVKMLGSSFGLSHEDAIRVMLMIHLKGRARVGAFQRPKAEALAAQVIASAREQGFPLQVELIDLPAA